MGTAMNGHITRVDEITAAVMPVNMLSVDKRAAADVFTAQRFARVPEEYLRFPISIDCTLFI